MCTVTYIPTPKGVFLTSNRDENIVRPNAIAPKSYQTDRDRMTYPKDPSAGGSWIVLKTSGDAGVLLNGAFEKHVPKPNYRKSRGLVMLDLLGAHSPIHHFTSTDFEGIEPFTIILFVSSQLFSVIWDGTKRHIKKLDEHRAHIFSSVTLYDSDRRRAREQILDQWLQNADVCKNSIMDFHRGAQIRYFGGHADIQTVSITCIDLHNKQPAMYYQDLSENNISELHQSSGPSKLVFGNFYWKKRRFFIRLRHWEYWPFAAVYLPMIPAWFWLSMKVRSLTFFSAANPAIENSGFIQERKHDIYTLLPDGSYPKTVFCKVGTSLQTVNAQLANASLKFPLIAKPDIGQRGLQVKLLRTDMELENYCRLSQVDFLLQEYIDHPVEVGIFYYRMPGSSRGKLSGIVGKELLAVTGDGKSTVLSLLLKNDRAILQLPALAKQFGNELLGILPEGITKTLVPYGNHSRGSKFVDLSHLITPALTSAIDDVCGKIEGFHYGRLDVRFRSWQDLEAGSNFSIIELNGAGSEPTHIYDPKHSIFFAWKEIYRHWQIMGQISQANVRSGRQSWMSIKGALRMKRDQNKHMRMIQNL